VRRVQGIAIPDADLDTAWPIQALPRDPYAGDEALAMAGSYADYRAHCSRVGQTPALDEAEHRIWDDRFERTYRAILDGEAHPGAIEEAARALLVWGRRTHDRRPLAPSGHLISDAQFSDMAENQLPQVGQVAPDRVLGPWADENLPRWVRVVAAAVMAFSPEVPPGVPAWARALKRRPRPAQDQRTAVRAIARVPPMLWRIEGPGRALPHLPLGQRQTPDGPIQGLPDTPAVLGRAVWTGTGWALSGALPLPLLPPAEVLTRRLDLELLRIRRRERRLTWEVLLRERPELLYRTACEWLWVRLRDTAEVPWSDCTSRSRPGPAARPPRA